LWKFSKRSNSGISLNWSILLTKLQAAIQQLTFLATLQTILSNSGSINDLYYLYHFKNKKVVLLQRLPRDAPTKVNKQPHLHLRSRDYRLTQFNRTLWRYVFNEHFLSKISPCSPGSRWMTLGLRRTKMLG